jgi:hypothetical protein
MDSLSADWVKVSARMPRKLVDRLMRLYPQKKLSELLRSLIEREIRREKVMKAHMKLYGRFKPEHFKEA